MSKVRLKVLLSFDHELHLGGWDSYHSSLFDRTDALLESAAKVRVPLVFFTDVFCAMRFREWGEEDFYRPYVRQIGRMLREGHDVQLHFHPHWLDSRFENAKYKPSGSFSFASLEATGNHRIQEAIQAGVSFLVALCRQSQPDYRCLAYRAGGYNLSPQWRVVPALYEQGIRFDSSVIKGFRFVTPHSSVDYTECPGKPVWSFPLTGPVTEESDSDFWEIPIACIPRNWFNNIPLLIRRSLYRSRAAPSGGRGYDRVGRLGKLRRLFPRDALAISFDMHAVSAKFLVRMLDHYVQRHRGYPVVFCTTCSHPKSMGPYNRQLFIEFVDRARDQYGDAIEFPTFPQLSGDELRQGAGLATETA
jgi:hypothetical protein